MERSIAEKIVVFQITPATAADIAGYMAFLPFYNLLNEMNSHAVIRVAAGSQFPGRFKDLLTPLSKESPMPWKLSDFVIPSKQPWKVLQLYGRASGKLFPFSAANSLLTTICSLGFEGGRNADYVMGIAVIRIPVIALLPWLNPQTAHLLRWWLHTWQMKS